MGLVPHKKGIRYCPACKHVYCEEHYAVRHSAPHKVEESDGSSGSSSEEEDGSSSSDEDGSESD